MPKGQRTDPVALWRIATRPIRKAARKRAHRIYAAAKRRGDLAPGERCEGCLRLRKLHGHHPDYTRPLDVVWLCSMCHASHHSWMDALGITPYDRIPGMLPRPVPKGLRPGRSPINRGSAFLSQSELAERLERVDARERAMIESLRLCRQGRRREAMALIRNEAA